MGSDVACCSVALMVLGICLYLSRNSFGVSMPMVYVICAIFVIPHTYSF
jgi:hypothetical protein